ncbi:MAG: hypothetical protein ACLR2E_17390 [Lachnospiraceae bacterium]
MWIIKGKQYPIASLPENLDGYPESRRTGESHAEAEWSGLTGRRKLWARQ